jgi:uncharacterized membrane protein
MAVPFEGFVVPSPVYVAALVVGTAAVVALLSELGPRVTDGVVLAFAPWMVVGAGLHVVYQFGLRSAGGYPAPVEPLFSAPAVYLTTFLLAGLVWAGALAVVDATRSGREGRAPVPRYLGGVGLLAMLVVVVSVVLEGRAAGDSLEPAFPLVGLAVSLAVTAGLYRLVAHWRPADVAATGHAGVLVLFAHVFDGVTTTIGVDLLDTGERSALPARIMDFAATLPTEPYLGTGWLFVIVKILVASLVVVFFADLVREDPVQANLLLTVVAAVGLGPGANNFLLFLFGG